MGRPLRHRAAQWKESRFRSTGRTPANSKACGWTDYGRPSTSGWRVIRSGSIQSDDLQISTLVTIARAASWSKAWSQVPHPNIDHGVQLDRLSGRATATCVSLPASFLSGTTPILWTKARGPDSMTAPLAIRRSNASKYNSRTRRAADEVPIMNSAPLRSSACEMRSLPGR